MKSGNCLVCGCYSAAIHHHHCVPQAYGGVDGPVVPLCGNCHTLVHSCANAVIAKRGGLKSFFTTAEQTEKAAPLVQLIVEAASRFVIEKTFKMTVEMDTDTYSKLKFLKKDFGTASLEEALKHCIRKAYADVSTVNNNNTENNNEKKRISLW